MVIIEITGFVIILALPETAKTSMAFGHLGIKIAVG
jgi:hypothetical protein